MMCEYWFSTPIYTGFIGQDFDEIQKSLFRTLALVRQHNMFSRLPEWKSYTHKVSDPTFAGNIIAEFELSKIHDAILEHGSKFYNLVNKTEVSPAMTIKESWITATKSGQYTRPHDHGDMDISGVYYFNTSGDDGSIHFLNPAAGRYNNLWSHDNKLRYTKYQPENGKIILFPSWLVHYVEENETSLERNSISFNITIDRS